MTLVCIDPPYCTGVVALRRVGRLSSSGRNAARAVSELFAEELTDKKNEAVANVGRFASC